MTRFHSGTSALPALRAGGALGRARVILSEQGLRGLWFAVLARLVHRRYHLLELRLDGPLPSFEASIPLVFEQLEPSRSEEIAPFWPRLSRAYFDRCFAAGYRCFVARAEGRPVAVTWAADDAIWSDFLECRIPLAQDEAYGFATYTLPEVRGKGVAPALRSHLARVLAESGKRRMFNLIEPLEKPSARLVEKLGYRKAAVVGHYRLGRRRWLFYRPAPGVAPPGERD
jgi:GNAT superfamily N-acetyltransferase